MTWISAEHRLPEELTVQADVLPEPLEAQCQVRESAGRPALQVLEAAAHSSPCRPTAPLP